MIRKYHNPNRRQPHGTARKSRSTITRHQEDKLSKANSSLFPIKMIAILEWTESNVQQNIEQLQNCSLTKCCVGGGVIQKRVLTIQIESSIYKLEQKS